MAKVYIARCIVKRDGKRYDKGCVIDGLTADEIKKGLAQKWLEAVGSDKQPKEEAESEKPKGERKPKGEKKPPKAETERESLVKKASDLGIAITDEMTADEIQQLITEKEAGAQ